MAVFKEWDESLDFIVFLDGSVESTSLEDWIGIVEIII